MSGILHIVQGFGYVQTSFAYYGGKAFHLYGNSFCPVLAFTAHGYEMRNASLDAGGSEVPYAMACFLCLAAYKVQKVYSEDIVLGELAE